MKFKFSKHYTIEEAHALLPQVREWLGQIQSFGHRLSELDVRLNSLAASGNDVGGDTVNASVKIQSELQAVAQEFESREIQIKDLERGLIDFPALKNGREIFLCWEKDEDKIEFWHDLDSGYPGRERLE
ncbi:MAG: DUF2203 domain-containing protein [Verrucomicrobiota bacterium]